VSPRAAALAAALLPALAGPPAVAAPEAAVRSVAVEGTRFVVTLTDGRVLPQERLPGTVLVIGDGSGQQRRVRIDTVETDPRDPAGEVVLYGLSQQAPDGSWSALCEPDPDGRRLGFPLAGAFTPDGRHVEAPGRFLVTCTGGAEGKCVRFGYKPWGTAPDGSSLAPYYQACVRMVRADYCGDGVGHTKNGTPIDLFDRVGIQTDEPAAGMTLEAAFGPQGAVCVRHTRWRELVDLDALRAQCPRLAGRLGEACDETAPALLYVRSYER
jgi:ADYC domain